MRINSLKGGPWILTTLTTFNRPQSYHRNMKTFFLSALLSLSLSIAAVAQGINIGYPADGASVPAGSSFIVEVDKPVRSPSSYHSLSPLKSSSHRPELPLRFRRSRPRHRAQLVLQHHLPLTHL